MKILIVLAHPSKEGFARKIANTYKEQTEKRGHYVEMIDLYSPLWKQEYLAFEIPKEIAPDPIRINIQQKIKEANHIVFAHPIWWTSVPAIMKNFLDQNFSARFAFQYSPSGKPIGLLKGKTADVFMTCGAKGLASFFLKIAMKIWWNKAMLGFCGIRIRHIKFFDAMQDRKEGEKTKLLDIVKKTALGV